MATVFINVSKAAPKFFFGGAIHLTEASAKAAAVHLKDYIGTYPLEIPEVLLSEQQVPQ